MPAPPDYYDVGIRTNFFQFLFFKWRFWTVRKFLSGMGKRVLDVGCHSGTFTEEISKILPKAEIYGIDVDQTAIAYAQKKRPQIQFKVALAEKLPFPGNYFDLITCFEVLEHTKNPAKVLSEINRCLKKDGRLIIEVPTENWLFRLIWFFWVRTRGKVWRNDHIQNFNGFALDKLLEELGFEIEERKHSHLRTIWVFVLKKK